MSLPVRRTRQADADLDDIWLHIAIDRPAAADKMIDRLLTAEQSLGDFPEIGEARHDLRQDLRHWPVPPYVIFYQVEKDRVLVILVLHGARDFPSIFGT